MKYVYLLALVLAVVPARAQGLSVKAWEAKSGAAQVTYIQRFADRIAGGYSRSNPGVTPAEIHGYFTEPAALPEGIRTVIIGIGLLKRLEGKGVDLSKVEIEDVVVWAIDVKFRATQ